jgi:copper chaperone CopZ
LLIEGMSCGHCAGQVEKTLRALPGVAEAAVDLAAKRAVVSFTADLADEVLRAEVTEAGFEVAAITPAP